MEWAKSWLGEKEREKEGLVRVSNAALLEEDSVLKQLKALQHSPPIAQQQGLDPRGSQGAPPHEVPALHALIGLYQQHFQPQALEIARQQRDISALLHSSGQQAGALLASAADAAAAANVAAWNLELVRSMQEEADLLVQRLQRIQGELHAAAEQQQAAAARQLPAPPAEQAAAPAPAEAPAVAGPLG